MKQILALVAVALLVSTCDSGPKEGELVLSLTTPNTTDGAVAFTLSANSPETIIGLSADCPGCKVFTYRVGDARVKGIVTGTLSAGPVVRAMVSNIKDPTQYGVTIQAVAAPNYILRGTSGYVLTVEKP